MKTNLANENWRARPADERESTMAATHERAASMERVSFESEPIPYSSLRVIPAASGRNLLLTTPHGSEAEMSHCAAGQLAARAGAPVGYLRTLPVQLAAECLTASLRTRALGEESDEDGGSAVLYVAERERQLPVLRALTSARYSRLSNARVAAACAELEARGWVLPLGWAPPGFTGETRIATAEDVAKLPTRVVPGDTIAPSGAYLSNEDLFVFLVHPSRTVRTGPNTIALRGVIIGNNVVGGGTFFLQTFLLELVCGNHNLIGAHSFTEVRRRHVGSGITLTLEDGTRRVLEYAEASPALEEARVSSLRGLLLGDSQEDVIGKLAARSIAPARTLTAAWITAEQAQQEGRGYGDPRTAWALGNGLTQLARDTNPTNRRMRLEVEQAAGKVFALAGVSA